VLVRELADETVLLNLNTETYFSLDDAGARLWSRLTSSPSIQAAYDALLTEYDVAPDVLRHDLEALLQQLLDHDLLELKDGPA
jgi:hypothetical protein